ncbi:MAG: tyrosine-type recombinase/integrase [Terriglobia bacterium]
MKDRIQTLATTLQPQTILAYGSALNHFLAYLHIAFPQVRRLSQLRRDPHLLGWFRWLGAQDDPPLSTATRRRYLIQLRRLFHDLADHGHSLPSGLILSQDLPPRQRYLPKPLSPQDDQLLQQELRRTDNLHSNALLLMRLTGIRLGECIHLALDCLRPLGHDQWALHVPLGKLHTERLVPVDEDARQIISRILTLRAQAPASQLDKSAGWLLPRSGGFWSLFLSLRYAVIRAGVRAGCSQHVIPHRLRHTFATEMLRLGISLPALMQLLGHKHIHMTLLYLEVTQQDLQREFHLARQNAPQRHLVPKLPLPDTSPYATPDLPGIRRALAAVRHLLEMFRRQLGDESIRRKLQRLDKRLLTVAFELNRLIPPENEERLAGQP